MLSVYTLGAWLDGCLRWCTHPCDHSPANQWYDNVMIRIKYMMELIYMMIQCNKIRWCDQMMLYNIIMMISQYARGFIDGWVVRWVGIWVGGYVDEWMVEWMTVVGWVCGGLGEWMGWWVGWWVGGWMDATHTSIHPLTNSSQPPAHPLTHASIPPLTNSLTTDPTLHSPTPKPRYYKYIHTYNNMIWRYDMYVGAWVGRVLAMVHSPLHPRTNNTIIW